MPDAAKWFLVPDFPGYVIDEQGICISPFGTELALCGRKKDCYRLRKGGREYELKISAILEAAKNQTPIVKTKRFFPQKERRINSRLCHDCKKPTSDYRCPSCLKKWRIKNGVVESGRETSFDVVFG